MFNAVKFCFTLNIYILGLVSALIPVGFLLRESCLPNPVAQSWLGAWNEARAKTTNYGTNITCIYGVRLSWM